jgi:serine/threonine protein kinase
MINSASMYSIVAMHLDLKPSNMMYFRESDGADILKAIDFGNSKLLKHADLSPDELGNRANLWENIDDPGGTLGYMSPEIRFKSDENSWEQSAEIVSNENPLKVML